MPSTVLHSLDDYSRGLTAPRVLLFKHSPACAVSQRALAAFTAFQGAVPAATTMFVDVLADRPVARGIAAACGVPHESPQAILFVGGRAVWQASHAAITAAALQRAWAEA